jgi:TonB-linked SusC/RagA family outer membrane protein
MKIKHCLVLVILLTFKVLSIAQVNIIKGNIKDEKGELLPGVSVVIKGTSKGTTTDIDGNYSLEVSENLETVLVFSYVGYEIQEIIIAGRKEISLQLKLTEIIAEETVVVGYGRVKSKELTGASSRVKGEDLEKMNVSRVDQALQGQVSGVSINTNSGSPGGSSSIRIRGLSTFGDNDPLILVDGIVYDSEGLNALNPSDIESINVLKDATAGIYGVRAANGVILVETKKGNLNSKPKFEFSTYFGYQNTAKKLNLLNAEEYAVIKNEMFGVAGQPLPFNNTSLGIGTNWQDTIFQITPVQNYSFSMSGGSKSTKYSIGVNYFNQDGIVGGAKSHFSRYNGRVNISADLSPKLQLNSVLLFSNDFRKGLPENGIGSVLYNTINAFPNRPVITPNGNYSYLEEVSDIINPVAQIKNTYNFGWANKFVGKEELAYQITKHLSFTNRLNYNYAIVDTKVFNPLVWYGPGKFANTAVNADLDAPMVEIAPGLMVERGSNVFEQRATYLDLSYEGFLNYEQVFDSLHKVKATAGVSLFHRKGSALSGIAYNIPNNSIEFADISANTAAGGYLNNTGSFEFTERLLSSFARAEYSYDSKYLISAILRGDGSSKFGRNNRYGFFPTLSSAWILSEEDFFKVKFIDFCKLRFSYGISGNDQIPNFAYRALLNGEGVYVFDDVITSGIALGRAANPDLKWETTQQFNFGLDLTLFKSLDITVNYFIKNTYNLLFQPDVSAVIGSYGPGGYPPVINAGNVSNKGIELELGYSSTLFNSLKYNLNFNLTAINNEVTKVPDGVDYLPGASFGVGGNVATRFQEGFPIGYFFGFETDGIYQTQEEIDASSVVQDGAKPGDFRFVDQNGDGVINFSNDTDRKMIGSPIPDLVLGFSLTLKFKGFDFSTNIYAALGQEIIRNYERNQPFANQLDYVIDRWVGPGTSNYNPRLTVDPTRNNVFSDYYVEDGSFMRIRNIQLGYSIPQKLMKKLKSESLRFYVAANNLLTVTNYKGFDPDIGPFAGTLSSGVDFGFYPQARTFMGGLILKF